MNILVTGGAGFIGSHVVDALIEKSHKVSVIDDLSTGSRDNLDQKATFYERSITDDISDIFEKEKPEVVFHLAAKANVRDSVENPILYADVNILGTINILENMRKHKSKKIVFSSTGGGIYGDDVKIPTKEDDKTNTLNPYGLSKLAIEKYLYYYWKVFGIQYTALRYGNVYGPRQDPKGEAGVIAIFMGKMLNREQPIINGTGEQTRDYVFVKDIVNANVLAAESNVSGIFNIGTQSETSVNDIFRELRELLKSNVKEVHGPAKLGEPMRSCLSYEKIKKELEWKPEYDIKKGLKETIEWFKSKKPE